MKSEEYIRQGISFVLYFYNDSCAPCVALRPKVESLIKNKFPKLELLFVNAAENPAETARHQVFASPTILAFFEGREYIRESKYISIDELEAKIDRYYQLME